MHGIVLMNLNGSTDLDPDLCKHAVMKIYPDERKHGWP